MTPPALGLPPDHLATAFPFHFILDPALRLVQAGPSLPKVAPGAVPGASFDDLFAVRGMEPPVSRAGLLALADRAVVLEPRNQPACLRGQLLPLDGDALAFLGSPWLTDPAELRAAGLVAADFARHDPVMDLLQVMQAQRMALGDVRSLAERLTAQREELRQAKEVAQRAGGVKAEFLARLNRDLRGPAEALAAPLARLLDHAGLGPEARRLAQDVQGAAERLLERLGGLLDFSRLEAGEVATEAVPFDVRGCFEDAVEALAERAHIRGLELVCLVHPAVPAALLGDPLRLRQVVLALVSNGIRFTERGEVTVRVSATPADEGSITLRVEVKDTGPGITPEAQEGLFELAGRAGADPAPVASGFGLAVCRRLVHLLGGEIGVKSAPGAGSTFWFTATLERAPAAPTAPADLPLSGLEALLVCAHPGSRLHLTGLLEELGARVTAARDAGQALAVLRLARRPAAGAALLVLDHTLPDGDGAEVLARLVAEAGECLPPPLLLRRRRPGEPALPPGAVPVSAPPTRAAFHAAVKLALARGAPATPETPAPARPRVLLVEDNPVNRTLALALLQRFGYEAVVAEHGRAAVDFLATASVAAVLMDCQMPVMDGYQATGEIRRREAGGGRVPIIAMTANALAGDRERCLDAGMDDYVAKPVQPSALEAALARWTRPADGPADFDPEVLAGAAREAEDHDGRVVRSVLRAFLEDAPERLGALHAAALRRDHRLIQREAHTLKSTASALGAGRLAQAAGVLEQAAGRPQADLPALLSHAISAFEAVVPLLEAELAIREAAVPGRAG